MWHKRGSRVWISFILSKSILIRESITRLFRTCILACSSIAFLISQRYYLVSSQSDHNRANYGGHRESRISRRVRSRKCQSLIARWTTVRALIGSEIRRKIIARSVVAAPRPGNRSGKCIDRFQRSRCSISMAGFAGTGRRYHCRLAR